MDIKKITQELIDTKLTQQDLADLVPCSQSLINAYLHGKRGARPSKEIGDRLEELHAQRCGKKSASRATDAASDNGRPSKSKPKRIKK